MQLTRSKQSRQLLFVAFFLNATIESTIAFVPNTQDVEAAQQISIFGEYEGYSNAVYENWLVSSQYIEMRDGVKLPLDVVRPTLDGRTPVDKPLPVIWTHSRYHRNPQAMAPEVRSMVDSRSDCSTWSDTDTSSHPLGYEEVERRSVVSTVCFHLRKPTIARSHRVVGPAALVRWQHRDVWRLVSTA